MDEISQIRKNIFQIMEIAAKSIPDLKNKSVLDIGIEGDPPPSGNYKFFKEAKEFKTADINPKFNPDFVDDITDSNFPDNYWDVVICSQVLEHVWDFQKAFKHLHRILKPGGFLIVDCPFLWEWHPTKETPDYWRMSPDAFHKLLAIFPEKQIVMTKDATLIFALCRKEENV